MTLIQLIDADTPKTFATQRGKATTKAKPLQHGGTEEAGKPKPCSLVVFTVDGPGFS
jgi:hypothetical protein